MYLPTNITPPVCILKWSLVCKGYRAKSVEGQFDPLLEQKHLTNLLLGVNLHWLKSQTDSKSVLTFFFKLYELFFLSTINIVSDVGLYFCLPSCFRASVVCSAHWRWSGFSVWVGLPVNWITTLSTGQLYWCCWCVFLDWPLTGWPVFGMFMTIIIY